MAEGVKRSPIRRKSPVRKKRPKPPTLTELTREADRLFSLEVRSIGRCEAAGYRTHRCRGILQCAHVVGRRYRSTRWWKPNAIALCAGGHFYWTERPEEWRDFIDSRWPGRYERCWLRAQQQWDRDLAAVLLTLREPETILEA